MPKYTEPGKAAYATVPPNKYIGKIQAFNTKGNWAKLTEGNWISFSNPSIYTFIDASNLTQKEIDEAKALALRLAVENNVIGGKVVTTTYDVASGVADAADNALDIVGFVGKNIKWVLLAVGGVVGYKLYKDYKGYKGYLKPKAK